MNTFFLVLFRPKKTFGELKTADHFLVMNLIILLFLVLLNQTLMAPITEKITSMTFSNLSENQSEVMSQVVHKMRYLQIVGVTIIYFVMFLFYALLLYVLLRIAKAKLAYKSALQLIVYTYFIAIVGELINTMLLYAYGDTITNTYEMSLTGLNLFTSVEQVGVTFYTFLSCFTPFQLIFVFLLSIGLKVFLDTKYIKALTIAVLFWLITILIPTLFVYFSELTIGTSEII